MFVCSFFFITTTAAIYICIQTPRVSVIIIVFFIIIRARNGLSAVFFAYSLAYSFPERLRRRVFSMNVFKGEYRRLGEIPRLGRRRSFRCFRRRLEKKKVGRDPPPVRTNLPFFLFALFASSQ